MKAEHGVMEALVRVFVDSKLTPLAVLGTVLLGLFAIVVTPREEEPQITVPMMDVFVEMPGASAAEIEQRVAIPMEKKLAEIPGVEYVYSTSMPGAVLAIVRFYVGEDEERSIVKVYNKLYSNFDLIPSGASTPLIKPRSIDDVPILALTLWGERYDPYQLRRIAAELDDQLKDIPEVAQTAMIGGQRRQFRVLLDRHRMAAFHVDPRAVLRALRTANKELAAGTLVRDGTEFLVNVGEFLEDADGVRGLVVGAFSGRPVYLRDVATVKDGPQEPADYVFFAPGAAAASKGIEASSRPYPAVTLSVAKRKGANAVEVAEKVLEKAAALRGKLIPSDVQLTQTRNYGETARQKSDELLEHLGIAIVSVTLLIALFLGLRASLVVLIAVPTTLALTLLIYYLYGYTINRVTLFALIFSIGILVDDPIVDVENVVRHFHLPRNKGRPLLEVTVEAVNEVRSPLILATFAVVFAILPMAFVRGLMGPYMRPIPIGASTAMLFSMAVAFVVTPWAAYHLLGEGGGHGEAHAEGATDRLYRRVMKPLLLNPWVRTVFLASVGLLLLGAVSLVAFRAVQVKMLPFDNKSEFQVVLDMPEGTPLETTARVAREMGEYLGRVPEVTDYQVYVGTSAPVSFNGLVRHYYLRRSSNVADVQVNLRPKGERSAQSHELAKRVRPELQKIASRFPGARVKVSEVPPGPPVLQTLVAEIYGPDYRQQLELAGQVMEVFERTPGVVDVDWYVEAPQPKLNFRVARDKAALTGVNVQELVEALETAVAGTSAGLVHMPHEKEDVPLWVQLAREQRSDPNDLRELAVASASGRMVPLSELAQMRTTTEVPYIYRKNLKRVVYVTGDVAGEVESPVYAILALERELDKLKLPGGHELERFAASQPFMTEKLSMKWDGEWHITYEVFRDLGLAFAAVMVLMYMLVVAWFQSFKTPLVILTPIPLSLIGILPAHWLMGAFFTATSMIGFIAGAGIVVRNSIILVDFIQLRRQEGMPLAEAVVDAGAVRFRPMLLTASAVVVGSGVILFDPIFQGLAISLIAGEVASTLLSRMAVPVLYYLSERKS
ncbi:MAG: efflux RND transporter permease subunit [Candidatus Riflebacteria bacterium]|nr:efflux RND transporter permease subunit [Candidatus Riflebacteria bacterium]